MPKSRKRVPKKVAPRRSGVQRHVVADAKSESLGSGARVLLPPAEPVTASAIPQRTRPASAVSRSAAAAAAPRVAVGPAAPARSDGSAGHMTRVGAIPSVVSDATTSGCAALEAAGDTNPGLAATYWFDAELEAGAEESVLTVRFVGRLVGSAGAGEPKDRFEQIETVSGITPGMGRIAVTTKVVDIHPGTWQVTATASLVSDGTFAKVRPRSGLSIPVQVTTVKTRLASLVRGPGVRPYYWPALVGIGVLVALVVLALLANRAGLNVGTAVVAGITGTLVGYVVAKAWYMVEHHLSPREFIPAGTCIQGFLLGAFATGLLVVAGAGMPVGLFLDVATPGVFLAMAVARPGCFLGGCCAGRQTRSRWGLWSSDRRVGIRRIPTQLIEGFLALMIGAATLGFDLTVRPSISGLIFVAAGATYTLGRQVLFPFRTQPRNTTAGRYLAMAGAAVVLVGSVSLAVVG